jgi:hypothetical protein
LFLVLLIMNRMNAVSLEGAECRKVEG